MSRLSRVSYVIRTVHDATSSQGFHCGSTDHDFSRLLRLTLIYDILNSALMASMKCSRAVCRALSVHSTPQRLLFRLLYEVFAKCLNNTSRFMAFCWQLLYNAYQPSGPQWSTWSPHSDQCQRDVILFVMRPASMCSRNVKTTTPLSALLGPHSTS